MASYRYRAEIPARQIGAGLNEGEADVVVFAKPINGDFELAKQCKDDGAKIVVDFCDPHFGSDLYVDMMNIADAITCPSEAMRQLLLDQGFDAQIINDPYEFNIQPPHADGDEYLWFGHPANIGEAKALLDSGIPLSVVTGPNKHVKDYIPYSTDSLFASLKHANIVIIPDGKKTRSNNRMVNAIAAGCFVVGGEMLKPWKKFVYSGPISHGLQFSKCFGHLLNDLVLEGQQYIMANHSPDEVGEQWRQVCDSI